MLTFALPISTHLRIDVFDAAGRRRATLVDKQYSARQHRFTLRTLLVSAFFLLVTPEALAQIVPHASSRPFPAVSKTGPESGYPPSHLGEKIVCTDGSADGYGCSGIDLLSRLSIGDYGASLINDVWGWTDPLTGREYALAGRSDGVAFVDVTDQLWPVYVGYFPSHSGEQSWWRDMKVYDDYMFVVVDNSGANGMQVFDLTELRRYAGEPIRFEETAHYDGVSTAHNIAINQATGYAYITGARSPVCSYGLHIVDISVPTNPGYAGCFTDLATGRASNGYTHDVQCTIYYGPDAEHWGKEICFASNETALSVADVTDKSNTVALSRASYPHVTYSHQGWLTDDYRYFIMNDELDESGGLVDRTRTLIWDVVDLDDPVLLTEYYGATSAIDHNLYVLGDRVYAANYASGLSIIDISDINDPREAAFFDTHPEDDDVDFDGAWTAYPYFGSGIIVVNSLPHGLFVLAVTGHKVTSVAGERARDYWALVSLYNSTGGANWAQHSHWYMTLTGAQITSLAIDSFYGVTVESDRVTRLELASNNLSGTVPDELGDLTALRRLDLSGNALFGPLPRTLMRLGQLEEFRFGGQSLCAPSDDEFQAWLSGITTVEGPTCASVAFSGADGLEDQSYTLGEAISDLVLPEASGGVAPYVYDFTPAPPSGLSFDANARTLSGTPESVSPSTQYTFTATDSYSESATIQLGIEVAAALALQGLIEDQTYTQGLAIGDLVLPVATGGSAPYAYTLTPELPAGLSFETSTRTLSGTPESLTAQVPYTYTATDAAARTDAQQFNIQVVAAALVLADSIADQTYKQGLPIVDLVLPAASGGTPPYSYTLTPELPTGLSFDAATRTLSGTPVDATAPTVHTYTVTDAASVTTSSNFKIEVVSSVSSEDSEALPADVAVQGNYPNPFTATTTLLFDLPEPADVLLTLTDVLGRTVLVTEATRFAAGKSHTLTIDAGALPAGAYMYRFVARTVEDRFVRTGTLLRVK